MHLHRSNRTLYSDMPQKKKTYFDALLQIIFAFIGFSQIQNCLRQIQTFSRVAKEICRTCHTGVIPCCVEGPSNGLLPRVASIKWTDCGEVNEVGSYSTSFLPITVK